MNTKLLTVVRNLAKSFSLSPGTSIAAPTSNLAAFAIPGSAQDVTIGTKNDSPIDHTGPHISGDLVSDTITMFYDIPFQNLDFWTVFLIGLNHKRAIGRID